MFFKENGQYRCAVYLRLSRSDGDQQESNSIKNQRALLNDYLGKHPELYKVDEYVDDGYSGTNFERPDFKRMMQDIEKRNVNCIIVKDLSRFGRNYIETGRYLERIFPFMGISVQEKEGDNTMFLSYCARKNAYDGSNEADSSSGFYHVRRRKDGKRNAEQRWSGFHPFYQGEGKLDCISDSGNRRTAAALI